MRRTKNKKTVLFILCITIFLITSIILIICFSSKNKIAVIVNNEIIYEHQLINVLNQSSDNSIKRESLLENSINQLVVVQYGKEHDINIEDTFFDEFINEYKKDHPKEFEQGINIFGQKEFFSGLKYHLIYQKTKDEIMKDKMNNIIITESILNEFLISKNIDMKITDENFELIKNKYLESKFNVIFETWVNELKEISYIEYVS